MATYYWVGGSGTWDSSTTTNWRTTSGGATVAPNPPTAADIAVFDTLSGTGTITVSGATCLNWTCSNTSTLTYNIGDVTVYGSITWASGTAITANNGTIYCTAASGAQTLNFAGKTADVNIQLTPSATGASYTLGSAMNFGRIVVAATFNTSASNFAMTATSSVGNDGTISFDTGYVSLTGIAAVTLNASAISAQNGVYFRALGTYALNLALGTSVITTVNLGTPISFEAPTYSGANTYSINATSAAGQALRPNGDLQFDDNNTVKITLALQQAGNTTGNTLQTLNVYCSLAASTVTFAGTTNVINGIRTFGGASTFTGAVVSGDYIELNGGTASFGAAVTAPNNFYANTGLTSVAVTGLLTTGTLWLSAGAATLGAVTCTDNFYANNGNTLNISGAVSVTNTAEIGSTGGTISNTFTVTNNTLTITGTITFSNTLTTSSTANGDINVNGGVTSFSVVNCGKDFYYRSSGNITVSSTFTVIGNIYLTGAGVAAITGATSAFTFSRSGGNLTLGAVTYSIKSAWSMQAGYTLTRSTSTISLTGIGVDTVPIDTSFDSGGYTYQNVSITGNLQTIKDTTGGSSALACAGTFTGTTLTNTLGVLSLNIGLTVTGALSLTGNSLVNRYMVRSNTLNSPVTITRGSNTLTNVDFSDITFSGTAATGTSLGNCLGCSNITFTTPVVRYARGTGNWSDTAVWSTTSGGATGATAPLAQDTVVFNAASGAITVTTNNRRFLGQNINATGFTGAISVTNSGFNYQASPTTVTITIASPAVFTVTAPASYANDTAVTLTTTGALPTGLSTGVTYYVVNSTGTTFNLATTVGGTAINTSGTQSGTQTIGLPTNINFTGSFIMGTLTVPNTVTLSGNDVLVFGIRSAGAIDIRTPSTGISYLLNTYTGTTTLISDLVLNTTTDFLLVSTGILDTAAPSGNKNITCTGLWAGYNPFTSAMPANVASSATPSKINLNSSTVTAPGGNDFFSYVLNMTASNAATTIEVNAPSATLNFTGGSINTFPIFVADGTLNLGSSTMNLTARNTSSGGFIVTGSNGTLNVQNATITTTTGVTNNGTFNGGTSSYNVTTPAGVTSARMSGNPITFYNLSIAGPFECQCVVTASNSISTTAKSVIYGSSQFVVSKVLAVVQTAPLLVRNTTFSYTGSGQLNTNNFTYYMGVTGSGNIVAPASTNIYKNTGVTFVGKKKILAYSAFSGAATIPSDITPGAVIIAWGGGGQGGKAPLGGGPAYYSTGGGAGAQALTINAPLTAGSTIYVNAPATTGKKTTAGLGSAGGTSWVNYVSNTIPASVTDGVLAVGGNGGTAAVATGGAAASCIGDYTLSGGSGGNNGGSGGGSVFYNGGNGSNTYRYGSGGAGYKTAGAISLNNADGGAGGQDNNGNSAAGGLAGLPPAAGSSGIFGGGGGGGGVEINNNFTNATSLTRTAGTTTATVTSPSHGIPNGSTVHITTTLVSASWTYLGTSPITINCSTPHGLTTGNTTSIAFTKTGGGGTFTPSSGVYTVTVTSSTAFTIPASGTGTSPTFGTAVIGNGITNNTQTGYVATVTGANTFTIVTGSSTNIYAVAAIKYRPITGTGADGGNGGIWEGMYQPDVYNNGSPSGLPAAGIGVGGGGGGGSGVYNNNYVLLGTTGSGGDGGVAAGGGGTALAPTFAGTTYGNGGAGGPGLIIIQYQVAQGTSQAGFVG